MKFLKLFENFDKNMSLIDILNKLGYKNVKKIANGGSSTIYTCSKKGTIIKVTNSFISANTCLWIKNNIDHPNIIKIKKVFKVLGDVTILDSYYNWNEIYLNSYPLYIIETEDLDRLKKSDLSKINHEELLDLCTSLGIKHQDLHVDNLMKRGDDIVMIDILDDSLPKQNIETTILD
jgi:hypothetical protein